MPEPTMGEMARWTFYQRFIAERTKDIDPRHVEAWMRLEHPTLLTGYRALSSSRRCTRRSPPPSTRGPPRARRSPPRSASEPGRRSTP
jgi:hypothetical protein